MSTHSELYLASRTALQAAQAAFRLARLNLRKCDPQQFYLIAVGETVGRNFRSPGSRSAAASSRRAAIEKAVIQNWSLQDPLDHDANWDECCRIGDILRTAGLYASGSNVASTVRNYALQNRLMEPRQYPPANPNPA